MSANEDMLGERFNIEDLIRKASARAADDAEPESEPGDDVPALDQLSPLPTPGDPYKAFARPSSRPVPTLSFLKADGTNWSYPNSCRVEGPHMVPANDAAKNLVILLRFSGLTGIEVTLTGRRLEVMANYIAHQRVAWVREQPKGKISQDNDAPVVTGIQIKELER